MFFFKILLMNQVSSCEQANFKHAFSPQEDERLRQLVSIYGDKQWKLVAQKMPNRTTRQCRERYKSYLAPDIKNGPWTPEEDELLKQKYKEYGSKWSVIQTFFKSRSDVNIKNRWTIISGRINREHKLRAYLIKTQNIIKSPESTNISSLPMSDQPIAGINNSTNTINYITSSSNNLQINSFSTQNNDRVQFLNQQNSPTSPISPSSPGILAHISPPGISNPTPSSCISLPTHNVIQDKSHSISSSSQNKIIAESSIPFLTINHQHTQDSIDSSNLPHYKKQRLTINQPLGDKNEKEAESVIVNRIKPPGPKKQLIPPISSLPMLSEDRMLINDKLFLHTETRIDESIITSGPNLTLANNFPHFGGNIW